jgi:CheY-like chemotaxis protein
MAVALSAVTVLILDDNPLVLKLGRALLEREGCTVLTASSWIEFNHVLAGNSPDIIFLDVNLPSIKGNLVGTGARLEYLQAFVLPATDQVEHALAQPQRIGGGKLIESRNEVLVRAPAST